MTFSYHQQNTVASQTVVLVVFWSPFSPRYPYHSIVSCIKNHRNKRSAVLGHQTSIRHLMIFCESQPHGLAPPPKVFPIFECEQDGFHVTLTMVPLNIPSQSQSWINSIQLTYRMTHRGLPYCNYP